MEILKQLNEYVGLITATPLIIAGFWGIIKYREQLRDKRFGTYHKLIDELVNEQLQPDRKIKLDRQIAIVYELRNFPNYFDVSKRILKGLQEQWKDQDERILNEIKLSISYMEKNWLRRKFNR